MKAIVVVKDEQKELFLALMKDNNFDFEVEEDLEVPEWQIDESRKRLKDFKKNPSIAIPIEDALNNIRNGRR
ncbi:MAG: hypothetical protein ACI8SE_001348 [Bacteroidia bacterium]|jgi:hypothetical protein